MSKKPKPRKKSVIKRRLPAKKPANKRARLKIKPKPAPPKSSPSKIAFLKVPGKARRYVNTKTGVEISRRQFNKLVPSKKRYASNAAFQHKINLYKRLRDDFMRKQESEGNKLTRRQAMNSAALKKIVRALRSKDVRKKAQALVDAGRAKDEREALKSFGVYDGATTNAGDDGDGDE